MAASLRVKRCGINSRTDLDVAPNAGAVDLGLLFGARHRKEDKQITLAAAELVDGLLPVHSQSRQQTESIVQISSSLSRLIKP